MDMSLAYTLITVGALLVLAMLAYATGKAGRPDRLTPLAGLAFVSILTGILLGKDLLLGYGLMALGVVFALIDIWRKSRGPVG